MNPLRALLGGFVLVTFSGSLALGQSVISAHSGLIHYAEGQVLLDGKPVEVKIASFPEMKTNTELRTEDGRAEVLLNPGVFLRLGEKSAVRMVSNKLSDSQMEFVSGSVVVEADRDIVQGEDSVTILYKGAAVHLRKGGIYRFDSEPAQLRVYSGEAEVESGANVLVVKSSKMLAFDAAFVVQKFDAKVGDALNRWSMRRGEYISMANVSAAKYVSDSGRTWSRNDWYYNPYFGMMTFLPGGGVYRSPYGYRFYSPGHVYMVYQPPVTYSAPSFGGGGNASGPGYSTVPQTSAGYSGVVASAPVQSSRPADTSAGPASGAAPVAREAGRAGGRR